MLRNVLQIAILTAISAIPSSQLPGQQASATEQIPEAKTDTELWFGVLDAEVRKFRFALEFEKDNASGDWSGSLLSLDEGNSRFPLGDLDYDGSESNKKDLAFEIKVSAGKFEGKFDENSGKIVGKWKQGGADLDLVFEKVGTIPREKLKALWVGEIKILFQRLELTFRELENGEILFDSTTQKAGGFVATRTVEGDQIIFEVPAIKAKFTGKMNEDGNEIIGKWAQGLLPLNVTFKKSENEERAPSQPQRPQTPMPPFPYESTDIAIQNPDADNVTLAGTLTIPSGTERVPAVILISGSGPQDRDESIAGHKPFWVLADHLSRHGIAVLRFDDRGIRKSRGDFNSATSVDFASDVKAIFEFLTKHERIDAAQVGLCGHSEGGIIAPMVAAEEPRIAFVVMLAGTGVTGEAILKSQLKLILEASGVDEAEVQRQSEMQSVYLDLATRRPPITREEFRTKAILRIEPLLTKQELESDGLSTLVEAAIAQVATPWFRFFLMHDPAGNLSRLKCPVLAINGSKDLQVDADLNMPAITAALSKSGSIDFETVVLPDLNHLFQRCKTGNIDEYEMIEETIDPAALETITDWILKVTQ